MSATAVVAASNLRQRASPRHCLRIRAPALGLEILINMRGPPCGLRREEAARDGEREQPRSGQRLLCRVLFRSTRVDGSRGAVRVCPLNVDSRRLDSANTGHSAATRHAESDRPGATLEPLAWRFLVAELAVSSGSVLSCTLRSHQSRSLPIGLVERPMRALGDHTYSEVA
jgi:hypothetical protein